MPGEQIPFYTTLPVPIPVPYDEKAKDKNQNAFVTGVQQGKISETGPRKENMTTVVTQYSLDHYLAQ